MYLTSFIEALGLTNEEIALLFDVDAKPLAKLPLSQILTDTVADPQSYLPDLGSADRAGRTLEELFDLCREAGKTQEETKYGPKVVERQIANRAAHYPLRFDKIMRMWRKLIRDQFVTFAEA